MAQGRYRRTVDIHNHVYVAQTARMVESIADRASDPFIEFGGESNRYNADHFSELIPKMDGPKERLADMDRMGIEVDALAIGPPQYCYWTPPELGAQVSAMQNDFIAEMVAGHPDRFVGMGTLPMQDPAAAILELERVVRRLGFPGASIAPSVNGRDLDHADYDPFWATAEALGATVILHPHGYSDGSRLTEYYMINVVGNPLDTTVASMKLIFGGVLERYPGLKIVAVHGGGYLPFYADRMDHAYEVRPECRKNISRKPTEYLRQMYFDTVVFGAHSLGHLVSVVGPEHVLLGTDYPYDMGETDPVGLVERVPGLTPDQVDLIVGGNAVRVLGLDEARPRS